MTIGFDRALGVQPAALALRGERTAILAANLANADTPGYQARDIDFGSALDAALGTSRSTLRTHPRHLDGGISGRGAVLYRTPDQPSADGNTVDVHAEQARFAENTLQVQAGVRFLGMRFAGLMSAIRGE